jgi:cyclic beta-1,2-glucan synthetase
VLSADPCAPGRCLPPTTPAWCDRRLLWRFGISGDRPLLLVSVGAPQGLGPAAHAGAGAEAVGLGGVACDLVVLNMEPASYEMALQHALVALREAHDARRRPACPA